MTVSEQYEALADAIVNTLPEIQVGVKEPCSACGMFPGGCAARGYDNPECLEGFVYSRRPIGLEDALRMLQQHSYLPAEYPTRFIELLQSWEYGHSLEWHRDNRPDTIKLLYPFLIV